MSLAGPILQVKKLRLWGFSSCPKISQRENGSPELVKMHILGLPRTWTRCRAGVLG